MTSKCYNCDKDEVHIIIDTELYVNYQSSQTGLAETEKMKVKIYSCRNCANKMTILFPSVTLDRI